MFPSGASVNVWTFFNSCVWVPQLSSVWKDGSQNHSVTAGKGSNIQKILENWWICRIWRIFLKNRAQINCSEQTRDSWTTMTKHKNSRGSSGNHTQYWESMVHILMNGVILINSAIVLSCQLNANIFLCKISYSGLNKK